MDVSYSLRARIKKIMKQQKISVDIKNLSLSKGRKIPVLEDYVMLIQMLII